jgi:hypothetical protein
VLCQTLPALAGTGLGDKGMGLVPGTEKLICTRTRGTRIHVPAGYTIPVSNTNPASCHGLFILFSSNQGSNMPVYNYYIHISSSTTSHRMDDVTITICELIFSWTPPVGIEAWMAKVQNMYVFKSIDQDYPSMLFL